MTHTEMQQIAQTKFAKYDIAQCEFALNDCHETAAIWRDQPSDYTMKLWVEIDAIRDRMAVLNKKKKQLNEVQQAEATEDSTYANAQLWFIK